MAVSSLLYKIQLLPSVTSLYMKLWSPKIVDYRPVARLLERGVTKTGFYTRFNCRGGGGGGGRKSSMHKHALARGVWGHAPPGKFDIYKL